MPVINDRFIPRFVGQSLGQEISADETLAANEREVERRRADLAAQRAQEYALQLQGNEIGGKRTLAADQYGYEAALADQRFGYAAQSQAAGFEHEDQLFEKHFAGQIAEQNLANLQAQKMAEFQAGTQEQRDYRLADINQAEMGQQQEFAAAQAERGYGQQEKMLGLQQDFQSQQKTAEWMHEATNAKMAEEAWVAREKIVAMLKRGEISQENLYKAHAVAEEVKQKQLEGIRKGIADGNFEFDGPEDLRIYNEDLPRKRSAIRRDPSLSQAQKENALAQVQAEEDNVLLSARIVPEFKKKATAEAQIERQIQQMSPEDQKRYRGLVIPGKDGEPQIMRGAKPDTSFDPISNIERQEFYNLHPGFMGQPLIRGKDGNLDLAPNAAKFSQAQQKLGQESPSLVEKKLEFDQQQQTHFFEMQLKINETRQKQISKWEEDWRAYNDGEPSENQLLLWEARAKKAHPDPPELKEYRKQTDGKGQVQPQQEPQNPPALKAPQTEWDSYVHGLPSGTIFIGPDGQKHQKK